MHRPLVYFTAHTLYFYITDVQNQRNLRRVRDVTIAGVGVDVQQKGSEVLEATDKSKFHGQIKTCWSMQIKTG